MSVLTFWSTIVVKRLKGKTLVLHRRVSRDHNIGEEQSDLENLIRSSVIEYWPIDQVHRRERNPRLHSPEQLGFLKRAIATFGILVPIVVDQRGNVLAGHARLACAAELGLRTVPVIVVKHLNEAEKRLFALADNRIPELSKWDLPALKIELAELTLVDPELDLTISGFDTPNVDRILASDMADAEDDILPDLGTEPITQLGDLWLLGDHRLLCSSALDQLSFEIVLAGDKAQMAATDPPYNVKIAGHARGSGSSHRDFASACGEMSEKEFTEFLASVTKHLAAFTADGAIIYMFMDHAHSLELQVAAYPFFGKQKQLCVWVKDNAGMGSFYRSAHELVYVYKNGTAGHINNFNLGEKGRYRQNCWFYPGANTGHDRADALSMHPTVKPCSMLVDMMLDCSHRGGLVLDCFGGSGTTLIAAERTGRHARLIELDPLYVDLTIRRWESLTGGTAHLRQTGQTFAEISAERGAK